MGEIMQYQSRYDSQSRRARMAKHIVASLAVLALFSWGAIGVAGADGPGGTVTTTTTTTTPTVSPGSPDVTCCGGGGPVWGVDSLDTFTSSQMWTNVVNDSGTPAAIGRYIIGPGTDLTEAEASDIHNDGASILLIDDPGYLTMEGSSLGDTAGSAAASAAHAIQVPSGTAIYLDVEPPSTEYDYTVNAAYVAGWYAGVENSGYGYAPAFYANSVGSLSTDFETAFCGTSTTVKDNSLIWSTESEYGDSFEESSAPSTYNPEYRGCETSSQVTGWQYLENDPSVDIDVDEFVQIDLWSS
jgi:hypothetical protein